MEKTSSNGGKRKKKEIKAKKKIAAPTTELAQKFGSETLEMLEGQKGNRTHGGGSVVTQKKGGETGL